MTRRPTALDDFSCDSSDWPTEAACAAPDWLAAAACSAMVARSFCRRAASWSSCCCSRSFRSRRVKTLPSGNASSLKPPARCSTEASVSPRLIG